MAIFQSSLQQDADFRNAIAPIDFGTALHYVRNHFMPEDVFEDEALEDWALTHGFTKLAGEE